MRIVVVGGGIVGLGSAYELTRDGHEVTLLDAGAVGAGASHGNAAKVTMAETTPVPAPGMVLQGLKWMLKADSPLFVRPSLSPTFVRFMLTMARHCNEVDFRRSLNVHLDMASTCAAVLDEWADDGLAYEMHTKGALLVFENRESFEHRVRLNGDFAPYGIVPEVLDADGVQAREPRLSDRARYGLFYPDDRQVEPDSLIGALAKRLRELGAQVLEHANVVDFEQVDDRVGAVVTDAGRIECDHVVLSAGVWTGPLAAKLGFALPIGPGKGYSVDFFPSPIELSTSVTFDDAHVAVTPLHGRLRLAGTMEFAGMATDVNAPRVAAVKRAAARGFRDWDESTPHAEPWAGLRPMSSDGLPIIGRLGMDSNVVVASGHGMLGLTLAPSTAKTVRDLARDIASRRPSPFALYGPERFGPSLRKKARRWQRRR